jgi:hypothetical protein
MSGGKSNDGAAHADSPDSPDEDPHGKDTIVPPYDVEQYARMASDIPPMPVTRSISVVGPIPRAPRTSSGVTPSVPSTASGCWPTSESSSIPPPPTVRRPDLVPKGILDDASSTTRVPIRAVAGERLENSMLDHREGFVLSLVDGQLDVEAIVDICGMPRAETLEILESLRLSGVIQLL